MKIKKQKNNGLTLIEALIVLALSAMILFSFLIWQRENALNETSKLLGTQLVTITSAIDQKITISGFAQTDENLTDDSKNVWRLLTFGSKDLVVANFFGKELIARDSICGSGSGWVPATAKYSKVNLIPCDLWKNNKLPFDMNALGRVVVDKDGFISDVYVVVYFPDAQSFKNNFQYLAKAMQTARSGDSVNKTGRHSYVLVNRQKIVDLIPSEVAGVNACYSLGYTGCALMAKYSRNNSYEYLRTDGTNSMLDTTVSFKKDKASERLKCNRWRKGDDGTWTLDSTVDCGIGIYKPADSTSDEAKAGNEDNVQVVVDYSTQKEIHMDKSCAVFGVDYAGTGTDVIKDLGLREPCGILNKAKEDKNSTDPLAGDVVYQLVDRVTADQGYFKDLYGRKLYIEDSSFIRGDLNVTGDAVVQGSTSVGSDLTVGGLTAVQGDLGVNSDATIAGNTTVLGKLNVDGQSQLAGTTMIKGVLNVSGNAGVTKNLTVAGNAEINGKAYYRDGLKVEGGAEANTFLPNRVVIRGNTCTVSELGLIAKDVNGRIISCVLIPVHIENNVQIPAKYIWGSASRLQQYTCPSYKNCGLDIVPKWDFCGFTRVGNLEDSHYCSIVNQGTTSAPKWRMDGYKGGCVVYCMNF